MSSSETATTAESTTTGHDGAVRLEDVVHRYGRVGETVTAVGPVDLTVPAGEFLVLVGVR